MAEMKARVDEAISRAVDGAIERTMAGLREVEAPEGMERRVMDAVRQRVAGGDARSAIVPAVFRDGRVWVAAACVVLVAAGIATAIRHERAAGVNGGVVVVRPVQRDVLEAAARLPGVVRGAVRGTASTRRDWRDYGVEQKIGAERISEEDALAVSEMLAPSMPAPAVPLTQQERLLVRILHKDDPEEIAMLEPTVWAMRDEEEKREFEGFFPKPAPLIKELVAPAAEMSREPVGDDARAVRREAVEPGAQTPEQPDTVSTQGDDE
jgi:hypothetical protein